MKRTNIVIASVVVGIAIFGIFAGLAAADAEVPASTEAPTTTVAAPSLAEIQAQEDVINAEVCWAISHRDIASLEGPLNMVWDLFPEYDRLDALTYLAGGVYTTCAGYTAFWIEIMKYEHPDLYDQVWASVSAWMNQGFPAGNENYHGDPLCTGEVYAC